MILELNTNRLYWMECGVVKNSKEDIQKSCESPNLKWPFTFQIFPGNTDMNTPVTNLLDNPVETRYVRFVVHSFFRHIVMRVEVLGCDTNSKFIFSQ